MAEQKTVELPEAHYSLIDTERDGMPAVVIINDAFEGFEHREIFPWHLTITIEATRLAKNGMPTKVETAVLDDLRDKLEVSLAARMTEHGATNILFLARITCDGKRELIYRVHDPEIAAAELMKKTAGLDEREWSYEMVSDERWAEAKFVSQLLAAVRN